MDRDSSKQGNIVGGLGGKAGLGTSGPDSLMDSCNALRQKEVVFSSYLEILLIFLFSHEIEVSLRAWLLQLSNLKT